MNAILGVLCFLVAGWVYYRSVWAARDRGMLQERERIRFHMKLALKGHLADTLASQLVDGAIDP